MDGRMNGRTLGWLNGRTDERTDARVAKWTDGLSRFRDSANWDCCPSFPSFRSFLQKSNKNNTEEKALEH